MRLLGNILWFIFGGFAMGLAWFVCGVIAYISIIGIPWGKACFVLGDFALFPFGREAVSRRDLTRHEDIGTGWLGLIGNLVWLVFAGLWIALGHIFFAALCFITIIGIPFGIQHLKMVEISLFPIGKTVVSSEEAATVRRRI